MDMVERIARAISLKVGQSPEIDGRLSGTGDEWIRYRKEAEAAVEAFLNPPKVVVTPLIERGAKAMWEASWPAGPPTSWADTQPAQKDLNHKLTHAVIKAIREPTEDMIEAVGASLDQRSTWPIMIDAALGKQP
jgi:hypothetical protein